jgi:hypothetical protein
MGMMLRHRPSGLRMLGLRQSCVPTGGLSGRENLEKTVYEEGWRESQTKDAST